MQTLAAQFISADNINNATPPAVNASLTVTPVVTTVYSVKALAISGSITEALPLTLIVK